MDKYERLLRIKRDLTTVLYCGKLYYIVAVEYDVLVLDNGAGVKLLLDPTDLDLTDARELVRRA